MARSPAAPYPGADGAGQFFNRDVWPSWAPAILGGMLGLFYAISVGKDLTEAVAARYAGGLATTGRHEGPRGLTGPRAGGMRFAATIAASGTRTTRAWLHDEIFVTVPAQLTEDIG